MSVPDSRHVSSSDTGVQEASRESISYELPAGAHETSLESVSYELHVGAQEATGESISCELPGGSFLLLEDHISAELAIVQGDQLQGPSVHSLQTVKSDSLRGTRTSETESIIGWVHKFSTTELLSPIASPTGAAVQPSGFATEQETSGAQQISYIEQPEFRQRVRPDRPGFKSPSLRIGSRGRTVRRLNDPDGSIPSQKTLPLPACSAARVAPPPLVDPHTRRVAPSAVRRRLARQLEQRLEGPVLDTQALRQLLRSALKDAESGFSRGDLCMRHLLRSLGHCEHLLHEIAACARQARKLPLAMRQLRHASPEGSGCPGAWRLLHRAVGLETVHRRLVQSLVKALASLGVGSSACCSLGHGMDRVPLPSLVAYELPSPSPCQRCQRSPEDLLRAAGQEAPFEPWWKCRVCNDKGRSFFLCAECGRSSQAAAEVLLSKLAPTQSWNSSMHALKELLSPSQDARSASAAGSASASDKLTVEDLTGYARGASVDDDEGADDAAIPGCEGARKAAVLDEVEVSPSVKAGERPGSSRSGGRAPLGTPSQESERVGEEMIGGVPSANGKQCGVPSATSDKSVLEAFDQEQEAPLVDPDTGDSDDMSGSATKFQFPATFLTCPDDASVVSSVSVEEPSAEPMPEPAFKGLNLFVKVGDLWTPQPPAPREDQSQQRWVLGVPRQPLVERRTFTKKLKLPVGPGLEKVMEGVDRRALPSKASLRVKGLAESRRRDEQGFEANRRAKEILRKADKRNGPAPRIYGVAPQELFDGNTQAMDMPVWQGVVDSWNRRIRAAAEGPHEGGTSDPTADVAVQLVPKADVAAVAAKSSRPTPPPEAVLGQYRAFDPAGWLRQAEQKKIWVDPDDVMQHYFEQACHGERGTQR